LEGKAAREKEIKGRRSNFITLGDEITATNK
jgi:hypothetical protein